MEHTVALRRSCSRAGKIAHQARALRPCQAVQRGRKCLLALKRVARTVHEGYDFCAKTEQ